MSTDRAEPAPLVLYAGPPEEWDAYAGLIPAACAEAGVPITLVRDAPPEAVDYIVYAPKSDLSDFAPYTNAKAVLSLWAGVEKIVGNESLTQPLTRMSDDGLRLGMIDWVSGHVLRHHLGMDAHILGQDGVWRNDTIPPLARDRRVGVLGLGALGAACAQALARHGFAVSGWSRRAKAVEGVRSAHGDAGLAMVLAQSEILVLLLPLTPDTRHIINAATLAELPKGAIIINPGRGPLIDDDALLAALDAGHIGHATLDVFATEPLPAEHPYWAHPRVTVTPHIASATRPETAAEVIAANILRGERGEPLLYPVDRAAGY
ncbi:2-hydroxyacid dehydrogenase [Oceanibium sediminis]|uniref:2-hydroxyacid dehydrogenase n=1 Tax=Oceanibium sediminis TaxID=2026339 RepID=UPI000DD38AB1|nr:glyoxylate/hydroxypyruvate reductase A [Oceanibium sediminis]